MNRTTYTLTNPTTGEVRTFQPLNKEVGYAGALYTTLEDMRFLYAKAVRAGFTQLQTSKTPDFQPNAFDTGAWRRLSR